MPNEGVFVSLWHWPHGKSGVFWNRWTNGCHWIARVCGIEFSIRVIWR